MPKRIDWTNFERYAVGVALAMGLPAGTMLETSEEGLHHVYEYII
jgi:hypothetical protein